MTRKVCLTISALITILLPVVIPMDSFIIFGQSNVDNKKALVTYIANEGFLVGTQNHKILFDALFGGINGNWCDQPSDSVMNLMIDGKPPFDNVDVVFVSHRHLDHFDPSLVIEFMIKHPDTYLVCPNQAYDLLKNKQGYAELKSKILSLNCTPNYDTLFSVKKVKIRAMRFNHGSYFEKDTVTGQVFDRHKNVDNIGYLVDIDGFKIFHSGDCSTSDTTHFRQYNINEFKIDIAFIDDTFLNREGQELMNKYVKSESVIFMHIEPGRADFYRSVIKEVPEMYVFKNALESKVYFKNN